MTITQTTRGGQAPPEAQRLPAAAGSDHRLDQTRRDDHTTCAEPVPILPQANAATAPRGVSPAGSVSDSGQSRCDDHPPIAAVGASLPADQRASDDHRDLVGGESDRNGSAATNVLPAPIAGASLADPFLALAADIVDDAERNRIANENRLRQLTRTATDSDGEERGFGLDDSHPDVARLAALVDMLRQVEHQAVLNLNRKVRAHPLGPWIKAQKGIGEKQAARLLACIGDPYWNDLHDRPRTVSELWAYCGYHTLPADQALPGAQQKAVSGSSSAAGGDHLPSDTQGSNVAARRQKGQRANWSTIAKTRAYLIAESCMKAGGPYREVYDKRKAATEGRTHAVACVRCGPSGKPAEPGTEWSAGHRHADALRITAKTILRDLWKEARRIHEEQA